MGMDVTNEDSQPMTVARLMHWLNKIPVHAREQIQDVFFDALELISVRIRNTSPEDQAGAASIVNDIRKIVDLARPRGILDPEVGMIAELDQTLSKFAIQSSKETTQ
jgi:hypothetical protein